MIHDIVEEEDEAMEEMIWECIDQYMETESAYMFRLSFVEQGITDVANLVCSTLKGESTDNNEDRLAQITHVWKQYCQVHKIPNRSYSSFMFSKNTLQSLQDDSPKEEQKQEIKDRIEVLNQLELPEQKTEEWYAMRSRVLTATAISKLFSSEAKTNSVIYEKCLGESVYRPPLSLHDPRHWGNKYEPVTKSIYETIYNTRIQEYGCIPHSQYDFIAASPDGINVYPKSPKYGRMIEIKNIVNREITGDPSEEYWIQMQIQMEVCQLNICDFVETRIKEMDSEDEYFKTLSNSMDQQVISLENEDVNETEKAVAESWKKTEPHVEVFDKNWKIPKESKKISKDPVVTEGSKITGSLPKIDFHGIILQFVGLKDPTVVHYEYMPLFYAGVIPCKQKVEEWRKKIIKKNQHEYVYVRTDCWYLDEISVVVVPRNRVWFKGVLPEIERVWRTIETERVSGFDHRKPQSRSSGRSRGGSNLDDIVLPPSVFVNKIDS